MIRLRTFALASIAAAAATMSFAGGHGGDPNVKARQAHMQLYGYNLGILGGMARGRVDYDAEVAQAAANDLAALSGLSQRSYWAPGTDSETVEGSRAKPELWDNIEKAIEISGQLNAAAVELAAVAGNGADAIGPALGPVGKACGACHEAFQVPNN